MKLLPLDQEFLCARGIHFKRHLGSAVLSQLCVRACVRACLQVKRREGVNVCQCVCVYACICVFLFRVYHSVS